MGFTPTTLDKVPQKGSTPCHQRVEPMNSFNTQTVFNYSIIVATQLSISQFVLFLIFLVMFYFMQYHIL